VLDFPLPSSCPFFLHLLPPCSIFLHLWLFFAIGNIHQKVQDVKMNRSYTSGLTDCSCLLPISNSIAICTSGLTDCSCLLPILSSIVSCTSRLLRLQLSSSNFKFNRNCTSGLLMLQLFYTVLFPSSTVVFFGVLFAYQHLIIYLKLIIVN
jgi:hypothetical protein